MGQALYRKHRPKSLSEIIGQEHVTDTLRRALEQGTVSHAYLLTGPKGVGKTSIARILAYAVNGLPYDEEGTHLDIIEIDAASNRRIDEIRELKERVNIAPTSAKYKVYIIDEVHMLTKEAFNALLKTLEEPPAHAIFILATTESHKVPETIISRTQRFTFKPVVPEKVVEHLKQIAKKEKIQIDEEALGLIAAHGEGSFRDSISLLDQIRHVKERISRGDVQQALGQAPIELLEELLTALSAQDVQAVAAQLAEIRTHGVQAAQIARQLTAILRDQMIEQKLTIPPQEVLKLLTDLLNVPTKHDPALSLELALFGYALQGQDSDQVEKSEIQEEPEIKVAPTKTIKKSEAKVPPSASSEDAWQKILNAIKVRHNTLYSIVRMGEPTFDGDSLTLSFAFAFHQKRLSESKNAQLLVNIIEEVTGERVTLACTLDSSSDTTPNPETKPTKNHDLQAISNIFGGAEVLE